MAKLSGGKDYPIYFGAGPELLKLAGELRKSMTPAEKILWQKLRNKNVKGYRFRRQHPIKVFIADFFCYEAMLVIEVDGEIHTQARQSERDHERTQVLKELGIQELRFSNQEVFENIEKVIHRIETVLTKTL
jgi:very-short-patch-repair endonuclease